MTQKFSRPAPKSLAEHLRDRAELNVQSIDGTVLASIVEAAFERSEELPEPTEAELRRAGEERQARFAAAGLHAEKRKGCFARALGARGRRAILEVKAASPSCGLMREEIDLDEYARTYGRFADAVSVLTEPKYFGGSFSRLGELRARLGVPLLAKDFVVSERQLLAAYRMGADAVLLMLSVLSSEGYRQLSDEAQRLGLEVLTEASSEAEALRAAALGAKVIGINNRNLRTLEVDPERAPGVARALRGKLPEGTVIVAESGYKTFASMAAAAQEAPSINAFLVGSALSQAQNLSLGVRELLFGESKVCGITRPADALAAARAGATSVGIILAPRSKRFVNIEAAAGLARSIRETSAAAGLPLRITAVLDAEQIQEIGEIVEKMSPDRLQIHGDLSREETAELARRYPTVDIVPVVGISKDSAIPPQETVAALLKAGAERVLLDAAVAADGRTRSGGTGETFDHALLASIPERRKVILAGGLAPENALEAALTGAAGCDFNSGVEIEPGVKSPERIAAAFNALRGIE